MKKQEKAIKNVQKQFMDAYDKYAKDIFRFVFYRVNSKEKTKDITQQTFMNVWKYLSDNNKKIKNIRALLYKTAYNLTIDYYRKPDISVPVDEYEEMPDNSHIDYTDQINNKQTVASILSSLKQEYRDVLMMRYIEDMSIKEISTVLNKSSANIYVLLHRALKQAKEKINIKKYE